MRLIHRSLLLLILSIFLVGCTGEEAGFKTFVHFNDSEKTIYVYKLEGVHMFPKGNGPQKIGRGVLHPDQAPSILTMGSVDLEFPIVIEWGYEPWTYDDRQEGVPPPKGKVQRIKSVQGVESGTIDKAGLLLLAFGQDEQWHMKFMPGDKTWHSSEFRGMLGSGKAKTVSPKD